MAASSASSWFSGYAPPALPNAESLADSLGLNKLASDWSADKLASGWSAALAAASPAAVLSPVRDPARPNARCWRLGARSRAGSRRAASLVPVRRAWRSRCRG